MKTIPLTQGQHAIVDDAAYEELSQHNWYALWKPGTRNYYAVRKTRLPNGRKTCELMHRRILGLTYGDKRHADHINHDTLDNRRENLRIAPTHSASLANRRRRRDNSSGFKGVYWNKGDRKWMARVTSNRKRLYLGLYCDPQVAYQAYCKAAMKLYGEYACLA
jgi:hypothetical protein